MQVNVDVHFFCFRLENYFWANLVQKIKVVNLSWNMVPRLIWICRIQWSCSLFPFSTRNAFFGPKNQNYQFKEVRYNCSAHRSAHLFIKAISSHNHIRWKQPKITFLQYSCSLTMINIVQKYLWRKIHELNSLFGSSNDS